MYRGRLSNGIKVVFHEGVSGNKGLISIAFFIKVGSRCEAEGQNGIAHFIEHIFFMKMHFELKKYVCKFNAVTTREYTCYYVICLKNDMEGILKVLSKIFEIGTIYDGDIKKIKHVIKQEILGSSSEICHMMDARLISGSYGNSGLGNLAYGKIEDIDSLSINQVVEFYLKYYSANNLVISICGKVEDDVIHKIDMLLGKKQMTNKVQEFQKSCFEEIKSPIFIQNDVPHFRMALALENCSYHSEEEVISELCVELLGGSNKSLLFRMFRDEYGVVYNIYMEQINYYFEGFIYLYLDTSIENVKKVCYGFGKLLESSFEDLFNKASIENAKKQLKFSMLCNYEKNTTLMTEYGLSYLLNRRVKGATEYIKKIDEIDQDAVYMYMKRIAKAKKNLVYSSTEEIRDSSLELFRYN